MSVTMRSAAFSVKPVAVRPVAFSGMHAGKIQVTITAPKHGLNVSNGSTVFAMRHGCKKAELGLPADQRKALLRALTTEVIRHGKITTTKPRAKAVRKYVDKMISLAKDGSLHARRQALAWMYDKNLVGALFDGAADRYADRNGGYCRVKTEIRRRRGDNAEMAVIELV